MPTEASLRIELMEGLPSAARFLDGMRARGWRPPSTGFTLCTPLGCDRWEGLELMTPPNPEEVCRIVVRKSVLPEWAGLSIVHGDPETARINFLSFKTAEREMHAWLLQRSSNRTIVEAPECLDASWYIAEFGAVLRAIGARLYKVEWTDCDD